MYNVASLKQVSVSCFLVVKDRREAVWAENVDNEEGKPLHHYITNGNEHYPQPFFFFFLQFTNRWQYQNLIDRAVFISDSKPDQVQSFLCPHSFLVELNPLIKFAMCGLWGLSLFLLNIRKYTLHTPCA